MLGKAPVCDYRRWPGIDVHEETVVVQVLAPDGTRGNGGARALVPCMRPSSTCGLG